jgi:hypothetical protein
MPTTLTAPPPVDLARRLRLPPRPSARRDVAGLTDIDGIFSDIVETAVTRAAGIPCSPEEYLQGLEVMMSHLERVITWTAATLEPEP